MLVLELLNIYDFHDSNINKLIHKDDMIILYLDLCAWKQKNFIEGNKELRKIKLTFMDIKNYFWDSDKSEDNIDYETILEFSYLDEIVKIILEDNDISIMTFKCVNVELEE